MGRIYPAQLSRRSILKLAGTTVAFVGISYATAGAASAVPAAALSTAEAIPFTTRLAPITGHYEEVPQQLGVVLESAEVVSSGGTIEFEFSPRLYRPMTRPCVAVDGVAVEATSTIVEPDPKTGLQRVTVSVQGAVKANQSLIVIAGALHPVSYPRDLVIIDQTSSATRVRRGKGGAESTLTRRGAEQPQRVWGCELAGFYERVDWTGGRFAFVPVGFGLTSVGPGPVPKGATVELRADARLLRSLTPAAASIDGAAVLMPKAKAEVDGDIALIRMTLPYQLDSGAEYTLICTPETTVPGGDLEGFTTPMVSLAAHGLNDRTQRETRRTAAVRTDSAPSLESVARLVGA